MQEAREVDDEPTLPTDALCDMRTALHIRATVQPGKKIEITSNELLEGDRVDVFLVLPEKGVGPQRSVLEILNSLPAGPRSYPTWEDFERRFQEDRDSWDR